EQGLAVINASSDAGADNGCLVHHFGKARQQFRKFDARTAMLRKLEWTRHQFSRATNRSLRDGKWNRLAVVLVERGLRIEQVHLARSTAHIEENDVSRARFEMRRLRQQVKLKGIRSPHVPRAQPRKGNTRQPATELA